jgi:hypothetical protein
MEGRRGNRSWITLREESPDSQQAGYLGRCISIKGGESPWISATENNRLVFIGQVRVKMCGKSAQLYAVMYVMGKPYPEQDKIGTFGGLFRLNVRVCRIDRWLPLRIFLSTESGLLTTLHNLHHNKKIYHEKIPLGYPFFKLLRWIPYHELYIPTTFS